MILEVNLFAVLTDLTPQLPTVTLLIKTHGTLSSKHLLTQQATGSLKPGENPRTTPHVHTLYKIHH